MNSYNDRTPMYRSEVREIFFRKFGDSRGNLVSIEGNKSIPFNISRVYYIYNVNSGTERGFHAHKNLKQVLIALSGIVNVICEYNGKKQNIILDSPNKGVFIDSLVWHSMIFKNKDSILMVIADNYYNENDYIRDYYEFKKIESIK